MKKFVYVIFTFFVFLFTLNTVNAVTYPFEGMIVADSLVVHSIASTSSASAVTEIVYGTRLTVTGLNGTMYQIKYDGDKVGYVSKSQVLSISDSMLMSNASGVESYVDYCNKLKANGFHESYCPYLYRLHANHPSWIFRANNIGKTMGDVANSEQWKVSLQTSNKNYWLSSSPYESDYYYVNASVISSFLDPRNSLNERYVFQFLDVDSSKAIANAKALENVAGSGHLKNFVNDFTIAGSTYGINPLHLMSRSAQEGANKSTFGGVTGSYTCPDGFECQKMNLTGLYNFFNIGAYTVGKTYSSVGRGVAYAGGLIDNVFTYGRPWNTPQKAIMGGAEFMTNTYAKSGQNSVYYEKFNIKPGNKYGNYTHQYMSNLYAPENESKTMYNGFVAGGLLNSAFVFDIPVFTNMENNISQAVDRDSNTNLSDLTINGNRISGFDSDVVEYVTNITTNSGSVNVGAAAQASTSKVSGIGNVNFVSGVAVANVVVTAQSGHTKTYKVTIKQVLVQNEIKVEDVVSKMAVKVNGTNMYGMSPSTNAESLVLTVTNNGAKARITDKNGNNKTGALATGDKIIIEGTNASITYSIGIRGDINGDGKVNISDFILVQSQLLSKVNLSDEKWFAGDVNYDGKINISDFIIIQSYILNKVTL